MCPFAKLALILVRIKTSTGSENIQYFACREEPLERSLRNARGFITRIPTYENLLTSVPTQNVDSAELTDIKRILNVLLKKHYMKYIFTI